MDTPKKSKGAPKKPETIKPGLRLSAKKWDDLKAKYPNQVNKMFNNWVDSLL